MTQAEYEAIKAQVLAEQKEERKARAKEREKFRSEAWHMFDSTEAEYLPKLVMKYGKKTGNYDIAPECKAKIDEMIRATLGIIGERNRETAYRNGRQKEANEILAQLLEQILNG